MIQLPYLEVFRVSGVDAGEFLHGQVTADTGSLFAGQARFAAYCSPKGQVIAVMLVCRCESDWLIVMDKKLGADVVRRLQQYVMRAKVDISHVPGLQVSGAAHTASSEKGLLEFRPAETDLVYGIGSKSSETDPEAFQQWRKRELLTGVCWMESATSERFIPQMLNLERLGALSFSKGCYPGQEIVARTHYLGKLKRKTILVECEQTLDIHAGDEIQIMVGSETRKGIVIQAVCGPGESTLIQAVAPIDELESVQSINHDGQILSALRVETPSY
jgi:folate-binding protein YgfZ